MNQILTAFSDVLTFLGNGDLLPATSGKLLEIINNPAKNRKLRMELAITVDAMEPFVKATYNLEGDGALALVAHEQPSMLYAVVSTEHYPNVVAVSKTLAAGNPACEKQLVAYAIKDLC